MKEFSASVGTEVGYSSSSRVYSAGNPELMVGRDVVVFIERIDNGKESVLLAADDDENDTGGRLLDGV